MAVQSPSCVSACPQLVREAAVGWGPCWGSAGGAACAHKAYGLGVTGCCHLGSHAPTGAACASAPVLLGGLFWARGEGYSKPVPCPAGLTWAGGCLLSP